MDFESSFQSSTSLYGGGAVSSTPKLKTSAQWRVWIAHIRSYAQGYAVWEYLDPAVEAPPELEKPEYPHPSEAREGAESIRDLRQTDMAVWEYVRDQYKERKSEYERVQRYLPQMTRIIRDTLAPEHFHYLADEETPRKQLVKLKEIFAPSDIRRLLDVRDEWLRLRIASPKGTNLDTWLTKWIALYEECKSAGVKQMESDYECVYDFLLAVKPHSPAFFAIWYEKTIGERKAVKFHELVTNFRSYVAAEKQGRDTNPKISFATLHGQQEQKQHQAAQPAKSSPTRDSFECPCERKPRFHNIRTCWYMREDIRPDGWIPNPEIEERVKTKMKDSKVRVEIERRLQQAKEQEEKKSFLSVQMEAPEYSFFTSQLGGPVSAWPTKEDSMANTKNNIATTTQDKTSYALQKSWVLDSGASCHVCNDRSRFTSFKPITDSIRTGDSQTDVSGIGEVRIRGKRPCTGETVVIKLSNVLYSPNFLTNLVSLKLLRDHNVKWDADQDILFHHSEGIAKIEFHHGMWVIEHNEMETALATHRRQREAHQPRQSKKPNRSSEKPLVSKATADVWHRRMGHMHTERLEILEKMVEGMEIVGPISKQSAEHNPELCQVCQVTKAHRQISRRATGQTYGPYGRVHFDLIHINEGYNGDRWITHFYIDGMRFHAAYTHESKNGVQFAVKDFLPYARHVLGIPLKVVKFDNERSVSHDVERIIRENGFVIEHSVRAAPEQNGHAERSGGVVIQRARSLLEDAGLPKNLWPEAIRAAVYILNRSPTHVAGRWIIPWQEVTKNAGHEQAVSVANLKVYGSLAYCRIIKIPQSEKMLPRAEIGYLVGYVASNIWRIWFPQRNKVEVVRDAKFDETRKYKPDRLPEEIVSQMPVQIPEIIGDVEDAEPTRGSIPLVMQSRARQNAEKGPERLAPSTQERLPTPADSAKETRGTEEEEGDTILERFPADPPIPTTPSQTPSVVEPDNVFEEPDDVRQITSELAAEQERNSAPRDIHGDVDETNIVVGSRKRKAHEDPDFVSMLAAQDSPGILSAFTAAHSIKQPRGQIHRDDLPPEPGNWKEMTRHQYSEAFMAAAATEVAGLEKKNTCEVVKRPMDPNKQVLPLTWVFTYKFDSDGYLVKFKARICVRGDLQVMTSDEKRAATLAAKTARAIFAMVAAFGLDTYQSDAISAFLNSSLDDEVYTQMPEGYRASGKCWRLLRALYGLTKSPRLWQQEATRVFKKLGLTQVPEDPCLFTADRIIVFFYVDDIIIVNHPTVRKEALKLREAIGHEWEIRGLGEAQWFLGIRIIRDRKQGKLWLCQDSYLRSMGMKFGAIHRRRCDTPLPVEDLRPYDGKASPSEIHQYQQKIGAALYATIITRPDAARAIGKLAEYQTNPGPRHLDAIDRVISYLYQTRFLAIEYTANRRSEAVTSEGYLCTLFGGAVDWKAAKQRTVTTSTTEAELLALTEAGKTVQWWMRLFKEIGFDPEHPITIRCDNQQTVDLLRKEDPQLRTKLRHVDIHRHWLRQEVQEGRISVEWVPTAEMAADGLTKLLPRKKHQKFVEMLGLVDLRTHLSNHED
ncbi:uncharacterized protein N7506_003248 [Penicillium brevicompactum]|uniref:uncharacterized protein n=1 Tax=Penicillium brevicompactum TaxID=5074 RepID=UPI00253FFEA3|nr:uncharacterized protein N7506_003248 [Penicillium brevicompactum]KAJ5343424.1 hypothetical protein N7506_003248 [Penicillium brevicompactum]